MSAVNTPQSIILDRYTQKNNLLLPNCIKSKKHNLAVQVPANGMLKSDKVKFEELNKIVTAATKACPNPSEYLTKFSCKIRGADRELYAQLVDKSHEKDKQGNSKGVRLRIYLIKKLLGKGGFGEAHAVIKIHTGNTRDLAAKFPLFKKGDPKDPPDTPPPGYAYSGRALLRELKNIQTIQNEIQNNEKAKSRMHDPHIPFINALPQHYLGKDGRHAILIERGDAPVENLKMVRMQDVTYQNMFAIARDVFNALLILQDIEYINGDIKKNNIIVQFTEREKTHTAFRAKLIDFGFIMKLPPDDKKEYVGRKMGEFTSAYFPSALVKKLENAKTNAEVREALILRQRAAFGYALYNILALTSAAYVKQNASETVYDFRLKYIDLLHPELQNLIRALFSPEIEDLEPFVHIFRDEAIEASYEKSFDKAYKLTVGSYTQALDEKL